MNKFWPLFIGLLVIASLTAAALAGASTEPFELSMTSGVINTGMFPTIDKMLETEADRATISCALIVDLTSAGKSDFTQDDFADVIFNKSVILTEGNYIGVNGFFGHKVVHIAFDPASKSANYYVENAGSGSDDFNAEYYKTQMEGKGFKAWINESDEMYRVVSALLGIE